MQIPSMLLSLGTLMSGSVGDIRPWCGLWVPDRGNTVKLWLARIVACFAWGVGPTGHAATPLADISVRFELQHSIDLALNRLGALQRPNGAWGADTNSQHELTAWVLLAAAGDPERRDRSEMGFKRDAALGFIAGGARTKSRLLTGENPVRATAASLVAFRAHSSAAYEESARDLSDALLRSACSEGGWNSGDPLRGTGADVGTTMMALRALYLRTDPAWTSGDSLQKARSFLQRCQTAPGGAEPGLSGSFRSPAPPPPGALRFLETSEGLLALLYSGKSPGDPKVMAALDWIANHYGELQSSSAADVNTYRSYYSLASAMSILRVDELQGAGKGKLDWRYDVVKRLSNLQEISGEWGPTARSETERIWCTAYATLTLEIAFNALDH